MSEKGHPQRGVTFYSYLNLMGRTMTLDDVFEEVADTGATCFELLTSYIEGYPNPSNKWIDHYWSLCDKYHLQPAELGHWAENHLRRGPAMSDDEVVEELKQDFLQHGGRDGEPVDEEKAEEIMVVLTAMGAMMVANNYVNDVLRVDV